MKLILVMASLVALAVARPEAGYSYQPPAPQHNSFFNVLAAGASFSSGGSSSSFASGTVSNSADGAEKSNGQKNSRFDEFDEFDVTGRGEGNENLGGGFGGAGSLSSGGTSGGLSGGSMSLGPTDRDRNVGFAAPVIHKHIYVHVPPPETEPSRPLRPYNAPAPRKHYKIVFIKAPAPPAPTAPVIPQFTQDEQKTLIYVLVKKPEEAPETDFQAPAPTAPSKPEVYFIRYKTQKEAGAAVGGAITSGVGGGSSSSGYSGSSGGFSSSSSGGFGSSGPAPGSSYGAPTATGPY